MVESSENLDAEKLGSAKENESFPLSSLQLGMYLTWKKYPGEDYDNHVFGIELKKNPALYELEEAWNLLTKRHIMLRTTIILGDSGLPFHNILKDYKYKISESYTSKKKNVDKILNSDREKYFQIDKEPGFRPGVIRDNNKTWFYFSFSHLYLDGQGMYLLMDELIKILKKEKLLELESYKKFSKHLTSSKSKNILDEKYWRNEFSNFEEPSLLSPLKPFYPSRGKRKSQDYVEHKIILNKEKTNKLRNFAEKNSISIHNIFQAAWGLALSRYTAKNYVLFGSVRRGRILNSRGSNISFKNAVGLTINSLPFSFDISKYQTVKELIQYCHQKQIELRDHERDPLNEIKSLAGVRPDEKLFDSVLTYQNKDLGKELNKIHPETASGQSKLFGKLAIPFSLAAFESDTIKVEAGFYSTEFDAWFIEDILDYFTECLGWIVKDCKVSPLSLTKKLSLKQKERISSLDRKELKLKPKAFLLHKKFKEISSKYPNKKVIKDADGTETTYQELEYKSNQVAQCILHKGLEKGERVGIICKKGITEITLLLGCLKAGVSFVPIPINFPKERIKAQLKVAKCKLIISEHEDFTPSNESLSISPSDFFNENKDLNFKIQFPTINLSEEAFLLFTSGSTGEPKAVPTSHLAFSKFIEAETQLFNIIESDVLSQFAAISFDVHLEEILLAILNGASLKICPESTLRSTNKLASFIEKEKISVLNLPTSFFSEIGKQNISSNQIKTVRLVITGGEKVSINSVKNWYQKAPKSKVYNTYGPTETTPASTAYLVNIEELDKAEERELLPIGQALNHADLRIIDSNFNPVPLGVWGELIIGNDACFEGYLNKDKLNKEKLIKIDGLRYFKTGDRVRKLLCKNYQISGRIDNQLKIRGNRFEPEEIELELEKQIDVKSAAVQIIDKKLCAFIESKKSKISTQTLRNHLSQTLPQALIPQKFYVLKNLPQTSSRKIDRKALKNFANNNYILSSKKNKEEKSLLAKHPLEVEIWKEVIGSPPQSFNVNFFEAGGDSLSFLVVVSKLEKILGCEINAGELFKNPTFENILNAKDNNNKKSQLLIQMSEAKGKKEKKRGSLVLLHPVDGNLYCYGNLTAELNQKIDIWGIQLEGYEERFSNSLNLNDYAKEYAEAIKKLPSPIILAGYSTGGCLAYEVASVFESQNSRVDKVLLFDTYCPGTSQIELNLDWARQCFLDLGNYFNSLLKLNKSEILFEIKKFFKTLKRRKAERKDLALKGLKEEAILLQNKTRLNLKLFTSNQVQAIFNHMNAVKKWRPGSIETSLILFRSKNRGFLEYHQPFLGWKNFFKGKVSRIDLDSGHYDFFSKKSCKLIAKKLLD